jgi:hypothetical protein
MFQFGVNTTSRGATSFSDPKFGVLIGALLLAVVGVAYSAWSWRQALAEDTADAGGSGGGDGPPDPDGPDAGAGHRPTEDTGAAGSPEGDGGSSGADRPSGDTDAASGPATDRGPVPWVTSAD